MQIQNIVHRGLRRLHAANVAKGLPADCVPKLRNMLAFLEAMRDPEELAHLPTWRAHRLTGTRSGTWSLHVTRNWRLTFWIDADAATICDVDFEDYH